ncbi:hypothetical protein CDN99_01050 [Roseateles aquatilis]|uniref:Solute-binding protein family 3/N-terminal domain-containing protein n=1 Tax=Roseateles aquatilis TaxID=431061 RepID=A0A246JKI8_9BURK|nr:transporter substrate-binding domain-containing protein [Roseateles aquatilis]OWQ93122.1 hypothetical protein CDN99_01050 [Roseateles aquatilis]
MTRAFVLCLLLLLGWQPAAHPHAHLAPMTMLVDRAADMPFAHIVGDHVHGGIHRDLAHAIAGRLGRTVHLHAVPRKRIGPMLREGRSHWSCALLPEWLDEPVEWTQPFLPHAGVVVTRTDSPRPRTLEDLAGQPIGVVKGYAYPELERALGPSFVRENADSAKAVLRMLELGRMQHASLNQQYLEYQLRHGHSRLSLHPYLLTGGYETRCAVSRHSPVTARQLDDVIRSLRADGTLARILQRYR